MPQVRTVLVIVLASAVAPVLYYFLFLALSSISRHPPAWVDLPITYALPVLSVVAAGFVSGRFIRAKWLPSSVAVGFLVSGLFWWCFTDPAHTVGLALLCAVGVPVSVLGGFLGSRAWRHASIAP